MALVIGHSQTKYLSEFLSEDLYSVFSYPGYRTSQFAEESVLFEVIPYFSVVVFVCGVNDIGSRSPEEIVSDLFDLLEKAHHASPSATIVVSEVLPRVQNRFEGRAFSTRFMDRWNKDASAVNRLLRELDGIAPWLTVLPQASFHTLFGVKSQLLSRDGLHLSIDGTESLCDNIDSMARSLLSMDDAPTTETTPQKTTPTYGPRLYSEVTATPSTHPEPVKKSMSAQKQPESKKTRKQLQRKTTRKQAVTRKKPHPVPSSPTYYDMIPDKITCSNPFAVLRHHLTTDQSHIITPSLPDRQRERTRKKLPT